MAKLELTNYSRKGIHAYVCPLGIQGYGFKRGEFINGTPDDEDKQRFYSGKSASCFIELDALNDGYYEFKEASGHKPVFGHLKIQSGEIVEEWDSKDEMLNAYHAWIIEMLPELEGSDRQVSWANQIQVKAVAWMWEQGWHGTNQDFQADINKLPTKAKWWIDSRNDNGSAHEAVRTFLGLSNPSPLEAEREKVY